MRKFDVYDALPDEMVGRYDVVAIRLFVCVVRGENPAPIIDMAMKMLSQYSPVILNELNLTFANRTRRTPAMERYEAHHPPSPFHTAVAPTDYA